MTDASTPSRGWHQPQAPMLPTPARILSVQRETAHTWTWELDTAQQPFVFGPGQFNMVYLFGVGEVPISISGDPGISDKIIHTIRAVGGVTRSMKALQEGAMIGLRGPYGSSWPIADAVGQDIVLMAGGIGLAPLRPVLYYVLHNRRQYGKLILLYGARQSNELLYPDELKQWRERVDVTCELTVDLGDENWNGQVGLVTQLLSRVSFDPYNTTAMLCGPEIMMKFSAIALSNAGVDPDDIYISMERNMKCAIGWCGHCQLGPHFVCKDGPVYPYPTMRPWLQRREA